MRLRRIKLFLLCSLIPAIVLAQSYFGNFSQSAKPTPAAKSKPGTSIPAPIPQVATPAEFRASINQANSQNRLSSQYQELIAKQPPLLSKTPMTGAPNTTRMQSAPQQSVPAVVATPVQPPTPVQPTAPTASQVQIAPVQTLPGGPQPTPGAPPPPPTTYNYGSVAPATGSSQVYTGFQTPTQNNNANTNARPSLQQNNNNQGGWKIKY